MVGPYRGLTEDNAAKIGSMAPGAAVKIEILGDGNEHTVSVFESVLPPEV